MYQSDYSDPGYWLNMIEEWRKAVEQHRPGEADSAAVEIGSWPVFELELSVALVTKLSSRPLYKLSSPPRLGCRALADYLGIKKEEDKNYWLKRGALLHSDIALLRLETGAADPLNYRTQLASINNAINKSKKRPGKNLLVYLAA